MVCLVTVVCVRNVECEVWVICCVALTSPTADPLVWLHGNTTHTSLGEGVRIGRV